MNTTPVLVTGATGTMGREVVRALLERGAGVRVLARNATRVAHLPASVERVVGDLRDGAAVERALHGVSAAFYVSLHEPDEEQIGGQFVSLCERHNVRLVFAGVHLEMSGLSGRLFRWFIARAFRHYRPKLRAAQRARTARTESIVLTPGNFNQNDELFFDAIRAGTYPAPLGLGNRVDVRDVGDVAARALVDRSVKPGFYTVSGPESLTGAECAAVWSRALRQPVRYTGDDIGACHRVLDEKLSGHKRADFRRTYAALRRLKVKTDPKEVAATAALLGRQPRSYAEYVSDVVAGWRAETTPAVRQREAVMA
jgi:uncharacterized protein YbjT (DUF2867 family)